MADLTTDFLGIKSPNPFWLASAPPTDKEYNVVRAFKAGWGGVVWKTLGEEGPPIVNVNGPRYGAVWGADRRLLGLNNIELITDRPLEVNLREIKQVKRDWPDRAMIVSIMVPCEEAAWKAILPLVEETGADGIELNFGCPHGMSERGMGSAVGQVPEYIEMVTRWCKQNTRMPVIVKLTPNITDVRYPARAAKKGGADAVASSTRFPRSPRSISTRSAPSRRSTARAPRRLLRAGGQTHRAQHGGRDRARPGDAWTADFRHRRRHHLARRGGVPGTGRGHRAGVHGGDDLRVQDRGGDEIGPVSQYLDESGHGAVGPDRPRGAECHDWQYLNLNYVTKARIDQEACIKCGRCYAACEDTSHQAISMSEDRVFEVIDEECVACNLCVNVCPVEGCITMEELEAGVVDARTGKTVEDDYANWTTHPNNPATREAAE
jgi:dihydropyrimidine dehydrogenase (NAD+) subunit PreA